ncbi:MAG: transglutaminase family protein [Desulfomonile sp.]|nr:transglutaminase family protein [Desulfomonile sp.]
MEDSGIDASYLRPTVVIDSEHPDVIKFAETAVGAVNNKTEQASRLFYAVRDGIIYDPHTPFYRPEHYRASNVLKRGRGFCVPKAVLLCALGRACGIPSRLGLADIRNHGASGELVEMMGCKIFAFHGFTEFYLDGKWLKATPSFDSGLCHKHNIAPLTFDGTCHAIFPSTDLAGNPYVEYLTYHGHFADLPLEPILAGWRKTYGEDRVKAWIAAFEQASAD